MEDLCLQLTMGRGLRVILVKGYFDFVLGRMGNLLGNGIKYHAFEIISNVVSIRRFTRCAGNVYERVSFEPSDQILIFVLQAI